MRFVVLLFLFVSLQQLSAQPTISQGKIPAWVTPYEFNDIPDTTETINGYAYLLISKQSQLESKEEYCKYVMKVTSEKGLATVASINEYFDPSFQKLTFHELNIIRNGKKINKLNPVKFDVLRREEAMERAVYDKSVNAIYNLPDVRVGDIVEYSFTRKGSNPVFGNRSFGKLYLQYSTPVGKFAYRIVCDPKRKLVIKTFGESGVTPLETSYGPMKATEWIRENVPAVLIDDQYPSWFNPYPIVQYSDFQSWDEVKTWALSMYKFPEVNNGELKKAIETIMKSGKSDEDRIKECIRIAQGDIRYLSFSDGIHGYKPHAPEMVYDQKYGDCKDKSFMLALMLSKIGITSRPALVSTENGYTLPDVLPNPWAFNHCIVQFTYNDSTYWIDPTLNAQVGPLKSYYFPSYHHALVINDDPSGLTPIPFGYKDSRIEVKEEYSMGRVGGHVTLKVQTTYYGDEADDIRSYFRSNTTDQVNKDYLNFYAKDFSEIELEKDFKYTDDPVANIVVSSEEYLLKNFWTLDNDNTTATVYAGVLATYLKKPETRFRTMPLAIAHPRNILQTIKILLPEEWNLANSDTEIASDAFTYSRSTFYADQVITLNYQYRTKASFIAADAVGHHIDQIDDALNDNGLTIYKPLPESTSRSTTNAYIITILVIAAGVYMVVRKRSGR